MKLFDFGTSKINTFLFLHREIIGILDGVFTGYKTNEHRFLQPDSYLFSGRYEQLVSRYSTLFNDKEVVEYINQKDIVITSVTIFWSLIDDFDANIKSWNNERELLLSEKQMVEKIMPSDEGVEKDIKLTAYELQKLLPQHQQLKEEFLNTLQQKEHNQERNDNDVFVDNTLAKLRLYGIEYGITPTTREFVFLKTLTDRKGECVAYSELAIAMKLNTNTKTASDEDVRKAVQNIKTVLRIKLKKMGVTLAKINRLCRQIIAIRGAGFMFDAVR